MTHQDESGPAGGGNVSRRTLVGAVAAGAFAGSRGAMAQAGRGVPPSVVTSPPRDFGPDAPPNVYVFDPDIVIVDPLFTRYVQGNTPIKRLWTGALWSEGPAWSAQGQYVVWSDIRTKRGRGVVRAAWWKRWREPHLRDQARLPSRPRQAAGAQPFQEGSVRRPARTAPEELAGVVGRRAQREGGRDHLRTACEITKREAVESPRQPLSGLLSPRSRFG